MDLITPSRRGFLGSMLAAGMAPAFVKASVLMPVRKIWTPPSEGFQFVTLTVPSAYKSMVFTITNTGTQTLWMSGYALQPGESVSASRPKSQNARIDPISYFLNPDKGLG